MEAAILEAEHAVDAGNHPFGMWSQPPLEHGCFISSAGKSLAL
jgi:hypothetical protein